MVKFLVHLILLSVVFITLSAYIIVRSALMWLIGLPFLKRDIQLFRDHLA